MYGGVGCGKTMLMDIFVESAKPEFQVGAKGVQGGARGVQREGTVPGQGGPGAGGEGAIVPGRGARAGGGV